MVIFIKSANNEYIWLAVQDQDTIQDIKRYIYQCEGVVVKRQTFMFNGKAMNEYLSLKEQNVYHLNSIHLV